MVEFKFGNVFFFHNINSIGGVETYFYELAKKYAKEYEIVFFYIKADSEQLKRLRKYAPVYRYIGQKVKCHHAFFNYTLNPLINNLEADLITEIIHADYLKESWISYNTDTRINKRIAVSKSAAGAYTKRTGYECEVVFNPLSSDDIDHPPLFICAAQRMTREKGVQRIKALVSALDKTDIKYYLLLFADGKKQIESKNIAYMPVRLDVRPYIAASDIFLVLSDSEGRCYSACEKLSSGHGKLLITPIDALFELGCNKENSIILNFDLSNMDEVIDSIREMYESRTFTENYTPIELEDEWPKYLSKERSGFDSKGKYLVRATAMYKKHHVVDNALGRVPDEGEDFIVYGEKLFDRIYFEKGTLIDVIKKEEFNES